MAISSRTPAGWAASRSVTMDEGAIALIRIQFFGIGRNRRPIIVSEVGIQAIDAAAAIRQSIAIWPPKSIGMRILPEGHKVFEQLKADRR